MSSTLFQSLFAHSLQDACQLLSQHHVALDLQLATHEGLHAVKLALRHGNKVSIRNGDGAVSLWVLTKVSGAIADVELENGSAHLHHLGTLGLDALLHLLKQSLRHDGEEKARKDVWR